jgi:hypothetical protein
LAVTGDVVRGEDSLDVAPWFLAAEAGHDRCAGWAFERRTGLLRCACGAALYEFIEIDRQHNRSSTSPVGSAQKVTRMTPVEMYYIATFLASKYPSARVQESSPQFWRALLAEVDDTDALIAFIRLVRRQSDIALADVKAEAHRIQTERLARYPESDTDLNQVRHCRTEFPAVLTSLLGRRVPCPWCGAAGGQACDRLCPSQPPRPPYRRGTSRRGQGDPGTTPAIGLSEVNPRMQAARRDRATTHPGNPYEAMARARKAAQLYAVVRQIIDASSGFPLSPTDIRLICGDDSIASVRRAIERRAEVRPASPATWAVVEQLLIEYYFGPDAL